MYRLYKKSEISFALFWIVFYCAVAIPLRGQFGDESLYMALGLAVLTLVISVFIKKYDLIEKYGLQGFPADSKRYLYFIPLWIIATGNLWNGFGLSYSGLAQVWATLSMILVGYIEEVIFRGFLFKAMLARTGAKKSIIIVAISFGIGHIVNLINGQASLETIAQVIFAIAWGFMFTIIFYKSKSLWPCILAHSLVNASSKYGLDVPEGPWTYIIASILVAALYCPYLLMVKDQQAQ